MKKDIAAYVTAFIAGILVLIIGANVVVRLNSNPLLYIVVIVATFLTVTGILKFFPKK